jgi:DNA (cytosine-5)-methyltransferase 1
MKFIDLFCGIGGFHLAMQDFGHECVLACDIDKDCMQVYAENFGMSPVNDITKIDENSMVDFDVLCGGFPCFVKGTPVLTATGYKSIEDVQLNDMLMTHNGTYHKILNKQYKHYSGNMHKIQCMYIPETVVCTKEHPFLVRQIKSKQEKGKIKYELGEQEWRVAQDIDFNSFIGVPINNERITPQLICKINKETVIIDKDYQWFMIGYFLGDGWIQDDNIFFVIANKQIDIIKPILERHFQLTICEDSGSCTKFVSSNQSWWEILSTLGQYAYAKHIPSWIESAPTEFLTSLVKGYASANGDGVNYKGTDYYAIETTSRDLALGMQRILLKLGIFSSVKKTTRSKTCAIQRRICNQRDTYKIRWFPAKTRKYLLFIENDYAWVRVKNNTFQHVDKEPVYNFEVYCDNSYVVNNLCVHNCQAFSHSGKQRGFEDTRGTLFYDICRILRHKQPKYFILENVKNLKGHDKGRTWQTIYDTLTSIGYKTYNTPIVLSPHHIGVPQNRERVFIVGQRVDLGDLKPYPVFEKHTPNVLSILQDEHEIPKSIMQKVKMTDDEVAVLNLWNEFVKHFAENGIQLPGFPLWSDDWDSDYDIDDLPAWKQTFIVKNRKFFNDNIDFLQQWIEKARECKAFNGTKRKFEWQAGKMDINSSVWNYIFQMRPSGIRVKKPDCFPALVAMAQIPCVGARRRRLTPRETARLQSFPETFKLHNLPSKAYKQFGNSVNVEVVKKIIHHLLE